MFHKGLPLIVLLILFVVGCNGPFQKGTVKIAVSVPLNLEVSQDMLNGIELALGEAGGQAGDVYVEIELFDSSEPNGTTLSPELELEAANKAIVDEAVVAFITGAWTDQTRATLPLLNREGLSQISLMATWPGLTRPGFAVQEPEIYYPSAERHFFRMVPTDVEQSAAAAEWAFRLGYRRVFVIDDGSTYGNGATELFEKRATELGMNILNRISLETTGPLPEEESRLLADQIQTLEVDLLYFSGALAFDFVHSIRAVMPSVPVMVSDGLVHPEFTVGGDPNLIEGVFGTSVALPAGQLPASGDFALRFQDTYGREPGPFATVAYDATKAVLTAIAQAERPASRNDVLRAMSELGEVNGLLGTWRFDPNGDITPRRVSGWQVQNGRWVFLETVVP
jgi:branched-chain amino acid transport system substrate-binding protein